MRINAFAFLFSVLLCSMPLSSFAQLRAYNRLPQDVLNVKPPSSRVSGDPGQMQIVDRSCSAMPATDIRRRIVNITVQEWAFFGMAVEDMTIASAAKLESRDSSGRRRFYRYNLEEASRVADSIAGYWAASPDSSWILQRQNDNWNEYGLGTRWRNFWSAAFISWVACESGLSEEDQFVRAIAHYTYIDQAIRARDGDDSESAYVAYDVGEAKINPGDLLCRGIRPEYRNLEQRRAQMGLGARTHCDIVVAVDEEASQIKAIGGNVRASVRMKILPATHTEGAYFAPVPYAGRQIFAHLKLKLDPIEVNALENSPTMQSFND